MKLLTLQSCMLMVWLYATLLPLPQVLSAPVLQHCSRSAAWHVECISALPAASNAGDVFPGVASQTWKTAAPRHLLGTPWRKQRQQRQSRSSRWRLGKQRMSGTPLRWTTLTLCPEVSCCVFRSGMQNRNPAAGVPSSSADGCRLGCEILWLACLAICANVHAANPAALLGAGWLRLIMLAALPKTAQTAAFRAPLRLSNCLSEVELFPSVHVLSLPATAQGGSQSWRGCPALGAVAGLAQHLCVRLLWTLRQLSRYGRLTWWFPSPFLHSFVLECTDKQDRKSSTCAVGMTTVPVSRSVFRQSVQPATCVDGIQRPSPS